MKMKILFWLFVIMFALLLPAIAVVGTLYLLIFDPNGKMFTD